MKKITQLFLSIALISSAYVRAQDCGGYYYITSNAGWTNSEWIKIIDIDAATLTDAALPKVTSTDGSKNANDTDFGSGTFTTPIMTSSDGVVYTPTSVKWPVKYYMAAFAPTFYTSAYSKASLYGSTPSGGGATVACTLNDNSIKQSAIYNKPGYIDLSRLAASTTAPSVSRHGYIEIDDLPQVERIQWSYSSTSWKRGVKADIKYDKGEWQPLRWVASDYSAWEASFSEQGYQFEEMINKHEDPNSKISIRFRIWDGDSIHYKVNANDLSLQTATYTAKMSPLSQYQVVRIHQIRVYSGIVPTQAPTSVKSVVMNNVRYTLNEGNLVLSETAQAELFTVEGKNVYRGNTNRINVSGLARGIYVLKTIDSDGKAGNLKVSL